VTTRQERLARAVVLAATSTLVTATAHVAGGGVLPPALLLLFVAVLGTGACLALGGRRVTLPRLVLAAGTTQLLLHGLFTVAGGHHAATSRAGGGVTGAAGGVTGGAGATGASGPLGTTAGADVAALAGHDHGATVLPSGDLVAAAGQHGGSMVLAHVVAAIVTVLAVRVGASALRAVVRAVTLRLVAVVALVVALGEPRRPLLPSTVAAASAPVRPVAARLVTTRVLRGPPALLAA